MNWFRLYHEARKDAKLANLTGDQHRVWFNLMCLAGELQQQGVIAGFERFELACEVARADEALLQETCEYLVKARIIAVSDDGTVTFLNWRKRQYTKPSDQPEQIRARVAKSRAKGKDEADEADEIESPEENDVTPLKEESTADGICVTPSNASETRGNANPSARDRTQNADYRAQNVREESSSSDVATPTPEIGPVFSDDAPEYVLAVHLADRMLENNPKAKPTSEKQLQNWANDVRLMVQRDSRTLADIQVLIDWSQGNTFWRANVLSMGKLREKFDQLWLRMQEPARASPAARNRPDYSGIDDFSRQMDALEARGRQA